MIDDRVSRFNFGGASPLEIYIFIGIVLVIFGYIALRLLKIYREDRKKFRWIYELAKSIDFTRAEIQDLKDVSKENNIKNDDQLYRILHSVIMLPSTRKKLYFGTKRHGKSNRHFISRIH